MSKSPLCVDTYLSPNCTSPRSHVIDTITIHCIVGQWSVETIGNWFMKPSTRASCNYGISKDGKVVMIVPESDRSWCSSNAANDNRAVTIEVASNTTHPYAVTDEAMDALVELCADICKRNGIRKLVWSDNKDDRVNHRNGCNMTVHRDFAAKACPGDYLYGLHGTIAESVNELLLADEEDEHMTVVRDNDASAWSAEARKWAVDVGLIQGDERGDCAWEDFLTREQLVTVLYRFAKMLGK